MNLRSLTGFVSLADPLDDGPVRSFAELAGLVTRDHMIGVVR